MQHTDTAPFSPHHFTASPQTQTDPTRVGSIGYDNTQMMAGIRDVVTDITAGIVVAIAVGFGAYSLGRKVVVDKQMRLSRQNRGHE